MGIIIPDLLSIVEAGADIEVVIPSPASSKPEFLNTAKKKKVRSLNESLVTLVS